MSEGLQGGTSASGTGSEYSRGRAGQQGPRHWLHLYFRTRPEMVSSVRAWVILSAYRVLPKGAYLTLRKYDAIIWDFFHLNNWSLVPGAHSNYLGEFFKKEKKTSE